MSSPSRAILVLEAKRHRQNQQAIVNPIRGHDFNQGVSTRENLSITYPLVTQHREILYGKQESIIFSARSSSVVGPPNASSLQRLTWQDWERSTLEVNDTG